MWNTFGKYSNPWWYKPDRFVLWSVERSCVYNVWIFLDHHGGGQRREKIWPASTSQKAESQNKNAGSTDWKQSSVAAGRRHAQSFCGEWGNFMSSCALVCGSTHWIAIFAAWSVLKCWTVPVWTLLRARWSCRTGWRKSAMMLRITLKSMCTTWGTSFTGCWRNLSVNLWVNLHLFLKFRCDIRVDVPFFIWVRSLELCLCVVQDRDALSLKLEDTEIWLYEDGEDQPKQVYIDKLAELKVILVFSCTDLFPFLPLLTCNLSPAAETGPAHHGEIHRGWREAQSVWGDGETNSAVHEICGSFQNEGKIVIREFLFLLRSHIIFGIAKQTCIK